MNEGPPLLRLINIHKQFDHLGERLSILEGIELTLNQGESVALSGPSGSGKSTLIHLIAGTDSPTQGQVNWRGSPLPLNEEERAAWRLREVGLIFQDFRLFSHLTALENAALPLELLGASANEAEERAHHLLTEVGLRDRLTHLPSQLSGGEQQRVALARALAHRPSLILADEPTGNLDRKSAADVSDLLLSLPLSQGVAVFMVTHNLALAERAHQHWKMSQGKLSLVTLTHEPTHKPKEDKTHL